VRVRVRVRVCACACVCVCVCVFERPAQHIQISEPAIAD